MSTFQTLLKSTISLMTVFLFGSAGEIVTEKSGHLNMGIPGIISLGGLGGVVGECIYMNTLIDKTMPNPFLCIFIPIIFAVIFGSIGGALFSFFAVSLRCNQNVVGLCLTTFGVAITTFCLTNSSITFFNFDYLSYAGKYFKSLGFPGYTGELNFFVDVLFSHGFLTYFAFLTVIVCSIILTRTKVGMNIRAVGENPAAADAAGINVAKYRYLSTIAGAAIASLGGLYLIMDKVGGIDPASVDMESFGWLAVALVIFSMWRPGIAVIGAFIFALFASLPGTITGVSGAVKRFLEMIPYILTILILIGTSIFKFKSAKAPQSLGTSYFREDR